MLMIKFATAAVLLRFWLRMSLDVSTETPGTFFWANGLAAVMGALLGLVVSL